jgi:hypothetical protein
MRWDASLSENDEGIFCKENNSGRVARYRVAAFLIAPRSFDQSRE